jgi:hypothetical protein
MTKVAFDIFPEMTARVIDEIARRNPGKELKDIPSSEFADLMMEEIMKTAKVVQ